MFWAYYSKWQPGEVSPHIEWQLLRSHTMWQCVTSPSDKVSQHQCKATQKTQGRAKQTKLLTTITLSHQRQSNIQTNNQFHALSNTQIGRNKVAHWTTKTQEWHNLLYSIVLLEWSPKMRANSIFNSTDHHGYVSSSLRSGVFSHSAGLHVEAGYCYLSPADLMWSAPVSPIGPFGGQTEPLRRWKAFTESPDPPSLSSPLRPPL